MEMRFVNVEIKGKIDTAQANNLHMGNNHTHTKAHTHTRTRTHAHTHTP